MTFDKVKATLEATISDGSPEIAEYIKGLDWDPTPYVLAHGERRVELWCCSEPPGYPTYNGYNGIVVDDDGQEKFVSGEWQDVMSLDVLEYLDTGTLPESMPTYEER
jgi:hypothetical protein